MVYEEKIRLIHLCVTKVEVLTVLATLNLIVTFHFRRESGDSTMKTWIESLYNYAVGVLADSMKNLEDQVLGFGRYVVVRMRCFNYPTWRETRMVLAFSWCG